MADDPVSAQNGPYQVELEEGRDVCMVRLRALATATVLRRRP